MTEQQDLRKNILEVTGSLNRMLNIAVGLTITASLIYILSMRDNPLHPANNIEFGAFLALLGIAGLYWLVTGIKPGLKISEHFM